MYTKDKQPSKLRLVLRAINSGSAASFRPAQWVYIQLPAMQGPSASSASRAVSRGWHPFSLAAQESSTLELLIDVHAPVGCPSGLPNPDPSPNPDPNPTGGQPACRSPLLRSYCIPNLSLLLTYLSFFSTTRSVWCSRWEANSPGPVPSSCMCAT